MAPTSHVNSLATATGPRRSSLRTGMYMYIFLGNIIYYLLLLLYIYNAPCIRVKNLLKGANKVMLNNLK